MATQVPPKKNTAYTFTISLTSQANTKVFQSNPTLATGDVKVRTDSGSLANITTLPTVVSSGKLVDVSLSASEMNGDRIQVLFSDASGDEWCDFVVEIDTTTRTLDDGVKMANIAHGGNAASITLTGTSGPGLAITGGMGFAGLTIDGSLTHGVVITSGGSTADSIRLASGANAYGINEVSGLAVLKGAISALTIDTHAEPGQGAPAATTSLAAKINYLFKAWRNKKTQTSSQFSLYDDAGTTIDQKATVSDSNGTTTVGEIASGP